MPPTSELWRQTTARFALALGSLFGGAAVVHTAFAPDLTVPELKKPAEPVKVEGFVAAAAWSGAKPGFVFKTGPAGLGYYPDVPQKPLA